MSEPLRKCRFCGHEAATYRSECPQCGLRYNRRLSPRALRLVIAGAALALIAGAAVTIPMFSESKQTSEQRARERQARLVAQERARLIREQRPVRGASSGPPARTVEQRRELVGVMEAAILEDSRARTRSGELDGTIQSVECGPLERTAVAVPDEEELDEPIGRYDCVARLDDVVQRGKVVATLGHPYVGAIDFDSPQLHVLQGQQGAIRARRGARQGPDRRRVHRPQGREARRRRLRGAVGLRHTDRFAAATISRMQRWPGAGGALRGPRRIAADRCSATTRQAPRSPQPTEPRPTRRVSTRSAPRTAPARPDRVRLRQRRHRWSGWGASARGLRGGRFIRMTRPAQANFCRSARDVRGDLRNFADQTYHAAPLGAFAIWPTPRPSRGRHVGQLGASAIWPTTRPPHGRHVGQIPPNPRKRDTPTPSMPAVDVSAANHASGRLRPVTGTEAAPATAATRRSRREPVSLAAPPRLRRRSAPG